MTDPHSTSLFEETPRAKRRKRAEKRFRAYGLTAIGLGLLALVFLVVTILGNGLSGFQQTFVTLNVPVLEEKADPKGNRDPDEIRRVTTFGYKPMFQQAFENLATTPEITTDLNAKGMMTILSDSAIAQLRDEVLQDPSIIGQTVTMTFLTSSRVDGYLKGRVTRESIANDNNIDAAHLDLVDQMIAAGQIEKRFNWDFIFGSDASDKRPEAAGFGVSMIGSFFMMLVVLVLALPIGVAASIYLEEYAPQNWFTDMIEVNISNLAAVPSIVFGILGLALFINFVGLPQSAPIVGGLVLTLMTLPTIIIATRAALKAVPGSIRDAALGLGASKMQTIFHHVLPLAMPGILTGTIIGLAQALGESAPLLIIGMVGYIATNAPNGLVEGLMSPNSAMPAQIYEWAKRADPAFYERAWGGIIILLVFLLTMNIIAVILRRRFERRW